jgi:hypothetical protein
MVGNSYLLGDYGRVALDLSFPPSNNRVAVVERAIRNEFPELAASSLAVFIKLFLNHFVLCSSEMSVDSNSKSRYQPLCLRESNCADI